MSRTWTIIEKIIGALLTTLGMVILYSVLKTVLGMVDSGFTTSVNITYGQLFIKNHLNFFLSSAAVFAGIMLCFNDKTGWLLSLICTSLYVASFMSSSHSNSKDSAQTYFEFYKSYSLIALLFFAFLILLLQKPFLKKYKPTNKNWLWVFAVTVVLLIDKFLFK